MFLTKLLSRAGCPYDHFSMVHGLDSILSYQLHGSIRECTNQPSRNNLGLSFRQGQRCLQPDRIWHQVRNKL